MPPGWVHNEDTPRHFNIVHLSLRRMLGRDLVYSDSLLVNGSNLANVLPEATNYSHG